MDEQTKRIFDVIRCQTIILHSAVKVLFETHPDKAALKAEFEKASLDAMETLNRPDIHPDAKRTALGIRNTMLQGILPH